MKPVAFDPPWSGSVDDALTALARDGHAVLSPQQVQAWAAFDPDELARWPAFWNDLPPDEHLRDAGRYRRRRHDSCELRLDLASPGGWRIEPVPPRAHWQPVDYNALHGGLDRWYEPPPTALLAQASWQRLLACLAQAGRATGGASATAPSTWFVESHLFRIDTTGGIGRPTPEGAHRDGVDLVAVMLIERQGVKGGETRVFAADSPWGQRYTLAAPFSLVLLDDARMIHETTPIQPEDPERPGHRDTLVITLRRDGFLGP